jgi:hypothetical protein
VVVPTVDVGIFLDRRFALESFEADDVCLRGAIAVACQSGSRATMIGQNLHLHFSEVQVIAIGGSHSAGS